MAKKDEKYIKDYTIKVSKSVYNRRMRLHLEVPEDLKVLLRRAVVTTAGTTTLNLQEEEFERYKVRSLFIDNLPSQHSLLLFEKGLVDSDWSGKIEFSHHKTLISFFKDLGDIVSFVVSIMEKYEKESK